MTNVNIAQSLAELVNCYPHGKGGGLFPLISIGGRTIKKLINKYNV